MSNLAMALLDLKYTEKAKVNMTEVYKERQRQLGREHPWTILALCYLAKTKIELGEVDEAEKMQCTMGYRGRETKPQQRRPFRCAHGPRRARQGAGETRTPG